MIQTVPVSRFMTAATSSRLSTTGTRVGTRARATRSISPTSMWRTSRYRNSSPLSAWFCVDALTRRRTASHVRNAETSAAPMVEGCAFPWNTMNRRIQWTYASSVRRL